MMSYVRLMVCLATCVFSFTVSAYPMIYGLSHISHVSAHAHPPFLVQMGAFRNLASAEQIKHHVPSGYPVTITKHGAFYAVIVGPIQSLSELKQLAGLPTSQQQPIIASAASSHKPRQQMPAAPVFKPVPHRNHTNRNFKEASPEFELVQHRPLFLQVDMGAAFASYRNSMTTTNSSVFPPPSNQDFFTTKTNAQPEISLMLGKQLGLSYGSMRSVAIGVRYQYLLPQNVGHTITQYSQPEFLNYNYRWKLSSQVVTAETKLNMVPYSSLSPYFNLGMGISFNHMNGYTETALSGITPRISPAFASKTSTQFAWHTGVGLDFDVNSSWSLSVGYDYEHLGPFSSGQGLNSWRGSHLALGNVNVNSAVIGMRYLLG